jgi:hypothetical protein
MIKTVTREHHWPPETIGGLFVDEQDFEGLFFWYKDVLESAPKDSK